MTDSTISDNTAAHNAPSDAAAGMEIKILGSGTAVTTIEDSTISGNIILPPDPNVPNDNADVGGGGLYLELFNTNAYTTTTLRNVTISGNEAQGHGGGILVTANDGAKLDIKHSTITQNRSDMNAGMSFTGTGGGIHVLNAGLNLSLDHTIVAGNVKGELATTPDDIAGTVDTGTYNLIGDADTAGGQRHTYFLAA
jgi:hypothetical protein